MAFQAIILCGPGSSFPTFTANPDETPKALLPIANRPMVWYPLEFCYRMGVTSKSSSWSTLLGILCASNASPRLPLFSWNPLTLIMLSNSRHVGSLMISLTDFTLRYNSDYTSIIRLCIKCGFKYKSSSHRSTSPKTRSLSPQRPRQHHRHSRNIPVTRSPRCSKRRLHRSAL